MDDQQRASVLAKAAQAFKRHLFIPKKQTKMGDHPRQGGPSAVPRMVLGGPIFLLWTVQGIDFSASEVPGGPLLGGGQFLCDRSWYDTILYQNRHFISSLVACSARIVDTHTHQDRNPRCACTAEV